MSGSSDKTVKLWDIRNYSYPLSTLKLTNSVEDFCKYDNDGGIVIANGNALSVALMSEDNSSLSVVNEYHPF